MTHRVAIIGHTGRGNYGHYVDEAFVGVEGAAIVALADPDDAAASKPSNAPAPLRDMPTTGRCWPQSAPTSPSSPPARSAIIMNCHGRRRSRYPHLHRKAGRSLAGPSR